MRTSGALSHTAPSAMPFPVLGAIVLCAVAQFALLHILPAISLGFALLMFVVGIPHGAVKYGRSKVNDRREFHGPGLTYSAHYLLLGLGAAALYMLAPAPTMITFLLLSALHFGLEDPAFKSTGLFVVTASLLLYPDTTLGIFDTLSGTDIFSRLDPVSVRFVGLFGFAILISEMLARRRNILRASLIMAVFMFLPPVQAVALYFLFLHSLDGFQEQVRARRARARPIIPVSQIVTAGVAVIGATGLIVLTLAEHLSVPFAAAIGVGFTIPHLVNALRSSRIPSFSLWEASQT